MTVTIKFARLTAVGAEKLGRSELAEKWVQVCGSGGENPVWGLLEGDAPLLLKPGEDFVFSLYPPELHDLSWWETYPDKRWGAWDKDTTFRVFEIEPIPNDYGYWVMYDVKFHTPKSSRVTELDGRCPTSWRKSLFDRRWATAVTSSPSVK